MVKHCDTSWNVVKHHELLLKHCETSRDTQTLAIRCNNIGARHGDTGDISAKRKVGAETSVLGAAISALARSFRRYQRKVSSDICYCGVGITLQMCNRVTNHGDMATFSKPVPWLVDSYDTHNGKRWLNSNPQTTGTDLLLDKWTEHWQLV